MVEEQDEDTESRGTIIAQLASLRKSVRRLSTTLSLTSLLQLLVIIIVALGGYLLVQQRQSNCEQIRAAFDQYTTALSMTTDVPAGTETELRSRYEPFLDRCE